MNNREEMSSWMDGEVESDPTNPMSSKILDSEQARQDWDRWHLIGDVMRSASVARTTAVADRVAKALEQEPLHFPRATPPAPRARKSRFAYGAAAAAAVAFVAVIAVAPQMRDGNTMVAANSGGTQQTTVKASVASERLAPVVLEDPRVRDLIDAHGSMSIRPVSVEVR